ncbi:MAG: hypothetical protein CL610_02140 [Anaerolineaceae bacterium]|nr:hypothetical protein [Anaerolineaceae bacterium]
MSTRQRGVITFLVMLVVAVVGCVLLPFIVMPGAGVAVALPIIEVPGEVVVSGGLFGVDLTNTIIGTILVDILLVLFVFFAWRASKGWTNEVPGRFQALVEMLFGGVFRDFMKGIGGPRLHSTPLLWPLVATMFIFLLFGNLMKLVPGVETVGTVHCSHVGSIGYPAQSAGGNLYTLYVDEPLNSGIRQTEATEEACHSFFNEHEFTAFAVESPEEIQPQLEEAQAELAEVEEDLNALVAAAGGEEALTEDQLHELELLYEEKAAAERAVERQTLRLESAEAIPELEEQIEDVEAHIAALEAPAEAEGDHGAEGEHADETVLIELGLAEAGPTEEEIAAEVSALQAEHDVLVAELNMARTQMIYPTAPLAFTPDQMESGAMPFLFHVTPWVRGPATDLSVALMLALLAIIVVQIYGVWALGPAYFEKFINISALGNLGKKPLGLVDFVVGLFEIISEIGKIVSLAFRLFGNLFAGGVALIALTFLVALLVPMVMYTLEIIIGTVQALVFAVLTLVFAVQAMEGHHGDEDHEHAEEH